MGGLLLKGDECEVLLLNCYLAPRPNVEGFAELKYMVEWGLSKGCCVVAGGM